MPAAAKRSALALISGLTIAASVSLPAASAPAQVQSAAAKRGHQGATGPRGRRGRAGARGRRGAAGPPGPTAPDDSGLVPQPAVPFVGKLTGAGSTYSVSFGELTVTWNAGSETACGALTLRNSSTADGSDNAARYSTAGDPGSPPTADLPLDSTTPPLVNGAGAFYVMAVADDGRSGISGSVGCSDGGGTGPVTVSGGLLGTP